MKKNQAITEYAVVIACLAVALIGMQAYFRRGLSGNLKSSIDQNFRGQFDPREGDFSSVSVRQSDTIERVVTEFKEECSATGRGYWKETAYSVTGPGGYEGAGIDEDLDRRPLSITTREISELDWKDYSSGD